MKKMANRIQIQFVHYPVKLGHGFLCGFWNDVKS